MLVAALTKDPRARPLGRGTDNQRDGSNLFTVNPSVGENREKWKLWYMLVETVWPLLRKF